jgi:putative transcriptional regulator
MAVKQETLTIRWKLKTVMADRDMSSKDLAALMNVNRTTLSNWRSSKGIPPFSDPSKTINALCFYLNCTPADLIEYTPDEEVAK